VERRADAKRCHLYINDPDHAFDRGLKAEAQGVADELTREGFPIRVELRYGRGDEKTQWQQIETDRQAAEHPDLFVVIPINKDAVYAILSGIVGARHDATCVFLHQPLTQMLRSERDTYKGRLFSVAADQKEIGRLQARQFAAVLPGETGDILYVQGRQNSYATSLRMRGLLEELPRTRA
jgi:ABC-type sugar transport system substrate-binding protein